MKKYPLFKVHVDVESAMRNVREVLESGFINEGLQVTELTTAMQRKLLADNLVLTNSCTSAITLALHIAGVRPGDSVVSTPMTCVATNTPVVNMGAKLIWADVDPNNGMLDYVSVAKKLMINANAKAIIAVAWAGTPPELEKLSNVCRMNGVKLILDAAHAFGATFKGKPIHEFADFTCYSLQAIKHITSGDGGILISRSHDDYQRSKSLKWFGLDRDRAKDEKGDWKGQQWDVDIEEAGYKFNMNNLSAAVGLSQIEHIDEIMSLHVNNAMLYDELFAKDNSTVGPVPRPASTGSSHWVYTMKLHSDVITRDELLAKLNSEGIMAGVVHVPNHGYTAFRSSMTNLPGVDEFSSRQFSIPCGWWMSREDIEHVAARVIELSKG